MAEDTKDKKPADKPAEETAKKKTQVRVIIENGALGHLLLKKGEVTDNEEYVNLLKTKNQKLVEEV